MTRAQFTGLVSDFLHYKTPQRQGEVPEVAVRGAGPRDTDLSRGAAGLAQARDAQGSYLALPGHFQVFLRCCESTAAWLPLLRAQQMAVGDLGMQLNDATGPSF